LSKTAAVELGSQNRRCYTAETLETAVLGLKNQRCSFVAADAVVAHGCEDCILVVAVAAAAGVVDIDVVLETNVVSGVRLVVSRTVC